MEEEIREAVETIVRKRVGWKSIRFDLYPQVSINEAEKGMTIHFNLNARNTGNDVIDVDLRPKLLRIEFLTN
jgi:hypothetical protein